VAILSTWECGSYLYGPQEFEIYLYPNRSEFEAKEMARIDQGLRVGMEVHYHPGKANVVVDMLSRKAHCNYLPAVHSTGEEYNT
jgi:hypothetical protein